VGTFCSCGVAAAGCVDCKTILHATTLCWTDGGGGAVGGPSSNLITTGQGDVALSVTSGQSMSVITVFTIRFCQSGTPKPFLEKRGASAFVWPIASDLLQLVLITLYRLRIGMAFGAPFLKPGTSPREAH